MSNSIFEGNIWDLRTGNDGEAETHEEAVVGEVVEAMSDDNDAEAGSSRTSQKQRIILYKLYLTMTITRFVSSSKQKEGKLGPLSIPICFSC